VGLVLVVRVEQAVLEALVQVALVVQVRAVLVD